MRTKIILIMLFNLSGLLLFFSWFLPSNHGFWFPIDSAIFYFFNNNLIKNRIYLWSVAITNNRVFDGFLLMTMVCIMLLYQRKKANIISLRRVIIIVLTILLISGMLSQLSQILIPVKRISPTLFFSNVHRVSDLLNFSTKDMSKNSFPGDHGLLLLIFSAFSLRYFDRKTFYIALIISIFFASNRIMAGAHWFTDIVVGSFSVAMVGLSWSLITPLSDYIIIFFDRYLPGKIRLSNN